MKSILVSAAKRLITAIIIILFDSFFNALFLWGLHRREQLEVIHCHAPVNDINGPLYQIEFCTVEVRLQELPGRHSAMFLRSLSLGQRTFSTNERPYPPTIPSANSFNVRLFKLHFIHQLALARRQRRDHCVVPVKPPFAHLSTTRDGGFTLSFFIAERQAGKLWIPIFVVFGLTRPGIESRSSASVADALSTRTVDL